MSASAISMSLITNSINIRFLLNFRVSQLTTTQSGFTERWLLSKTVAVTNFYALNLNLWLGQSSKHIAGLGQRIAVIKSSAPEDFLCSRRVITVHSIWYYMYAPVASGNFSRFSSIK